MILHLSHQSLDGSVDINITLNSYYHGSALDAMSDQLSFVMGTQEMVQRAWSLGITNDANKKFICDGNSDIMLNDCLDCDFGKEWLFQKMTL